MQLPSATTLLLALPLLSAPAAAKVNWEVIYDTYPDRPYCADFRVWDDAVDFGKHTIHRRSCTSHDHNNNKQWTFDLAGSVSRYSATIHQNHFWIIKGFGVTYRTPHGTFYWSTGDLRREGNSDRWRAKGTALG